MCPAPAPKKDRGNQREGLLQPTDGLQPGRLGDVLLQPQVKVRTAIDAMSATGARAVRIVNEARPEIQFHVNDWDARASEFIERNIVLNGLDKGKAINDDLRCLLAKETSIT